MRRCGAKAPPRCLRRRRMRRRRSQAEPTVLAPAQARLPSTAARIAFAAAASVATVAVVGWIGAARTRRLPREPVVAKSRRPPRSAGGRRAVAVPTTVRAAPTPTCSDYLVVHRQVPTPSSTGRWHNQAAGGPMRRLGGGRRWLPRCASVACRAAAAPRAPIRSPGCSAPRRRRAHDLRRHVRAHARRAHLHRRASRTCSSAGYGARAHRVPRRPAAARSCAATTRCTATSRTRRRSASTGACTREVLPVPGERPARGHRRELQASRWATSSASWATTATGSTSIRRTPCATRSACASSWAPGLAAARQDARGEAAGARAVHLHRPSRGPAGLPQRGEEHLPRAEQGLAPTSSRRDESTAGRHRLGRRRAAPAGFRLVSEMHRTLPDRPQPVTQLVLSDGLATMSVFVEPMSSPPRTAEATSEDGTLVGLRPPDGRAPRHRAGRSAARRRRSRWAAASAGSRYRGNRAAIYGVPCQARSPRTKHHEPTADMPSARHDRDGQFPASRSRPACTARGPGHAEAPQAPGAQVLPNFADLVEKHGPAVVNINTQTRAPQRTQIPGLSEDDPMYEFFRRFMPPDQRQPPRRAEARRQGRRPGAHAGRCARSAWAPGS